MADTLLTRFARPVATRSLLAFCLLALFFCICASPAWSVCVPYPSYTDPYRGYSPAGMDGASEEDHEWHRAVRELDNGDGTPQFEFKKRPGTRYDNIEPIGLGGNARGWVGTRNGCKQLLDHAGKPFPIPSFNTVADGGNLGQGSIIIPRNQRLLELSSHEKAITVLFKRGKILAQSPVYAPGRSTPFSESNRLPAHTKEIVLGPDRKYALMDLRTLKLILAAEWDQIRGVGVDFDHQRARYYLTRRGQEQFLIPLRGGRPIVGGIASLKLINGWFYKHPSGRPVDQAVLVVKMNGEAGCRLLDMRLRPLLPHHTREIYGTCAVPNPAFHKYLITDADGEGAHTYAVDPTGHLRLLSTIPGELVFAEERRGLLLMRQPAATGQFYRVYFPNGERANSEVFSDFKDLGCGMLRVKLGDQWLTLLHDGKTTMKRFYSLAC